MLGGLRRSLARMMRTAAVLALVLLLNGCANVPRLVEPADGEMRLSERESALFERTHFSLNGRIAVSNAKDGGSGRFFWRQKGESFELRFVAPVGSQNWRIESRPGQARLIASDGTARIAATADELLARELGWRVPSRSMRYWILGMRAPEADARAIFDDAGNLQSLNQAGWQIDYIRFDPALIPPLPTKLFARSGDNEVRISIRQWQFE